MFHLVWFLIPRRQTSSFLGDPRDTATLSQLTLCMDDTTEGHFWKKNNNRGYMEYREYLECGEQKGNIGNIGNIGNTWNIGNRGDIGNIQT